MARERGTSAVVKFEPSPWLLVIAVGLFVVMLQQNSERAYWRGIADDTAERVEVQQTVIDSVQTRADSLEVYLAEADSVADAQRLANEREVARLNRERTEDRERTEAISERLRASLDSMQTVELDSIVLGYENQIVSLYSIIEAERKNTMSEALRADAASELVLGLREHIGELEIKSFMLGAQVNALRESMKPSLGLRLKADWWLAVAGLAGGYLLWGTNE
jgi:hypothetical protein